MFVNLQQLKEYAPAVLRIGLGLVFLWFAISQFIDPASWLGYLPPWTANMPISQTTFVLLNASFEAIFGLLLLLGIFPRISAMLLAIHLVGIITSVGYNEIGVRDFGLLIATTTIAMNGSDDLCIIKKL